MVGPKPNSRSTKITHIRIEQRLDFGLPLEAGIERIRQYAEGLIDPKFGSIYEHSYGTDHDSEQLAILGWREMTKGELAIYKEQSAALDQQKKEWERKQFEQLKKTHPEWIRDDVEAP
jgi:hypothetical protein